MTAFMDMDAEETVVLGGRQFGKSTWGGLNLAIKNASSPGYRTLYTAPTGKQVSVFSNDVYASLCTMSPAIKKICDFKNEWQMGARSFTTGSKCYFRSVFHSADSARGISAGWIQFDEFQDMIMDVVGVLKQSATNYPDRRFFYTGTPKTFSNQITTYFDHSCGYEWMVKCKSCNHYNYMDESILGKKGYICQKCGKPINIQTGVWVPRKPKQIGIFNGFRVPKFLNPNISFTDVIRERDNPFMTRAAFYNEVLGLPYAQGELALTVGDMKAACDGKRDMGRIGTKYPFPLVAGVDWGTGDQAAIGKAGARVRSFTVVTIGGWYKDKFRVVYMRKLIGEEADIYRQPAVVNHILRSFGVETVVCDWGFGASQNARLINEFDWSPDQLYEVQYGSMVNLVKWNREAQRYIVDRTEQHHKLIDDIKRRRITFPKWGDTGPFHEDFTCIFVEFDAIRGTMRFDHPSGKPDDTFQSLVYAKFALDINRGHTSKFSRGLVE